MRDTPPPHPGVRFPPPFVYVIGFVLGLWIERHHPLAFVPPRSGLRWLPEAAGLLAFVACALFLFGALATFRRERTTVLPNRPASALATGGPYRFTRNPMYVGMALLYLGLALVLNTVWPLAFLPLVLLLIDTAVIRREERYLISAFGEEYRSYCSRVRRWL